MWIYNWDILRYYALHSQHDMISGYIWVYLKMWYTPPALAILIGIMMINQWIWGIPFSNKPTYD